MKLNYSLRNEANAVPEILIYDQIGEDYWSGEGVTAKNIKSDLAALGNVAEVNVRINSEGGNAWEGFAIYNAFKEASVRGTKIVVTIDAIALSAGSIIAMAGDVIRAQENALVMIHNASTYVGGDAVALRKMVDLLEKLDGQIRDLYAARTGADANAVEKWMDEETWFTAAEAKEQKFVDEIIPNKAAPPPLSNATMKRVRNAPAWIRQQAAERPRYTAALALHSARNVS